MNELCFTDSLEGQYKHRENNNSNIDAPHLHHHNLDLIGSLIDIWSDLDLYDMGGGIDKNENTPSNYNQSTSSSLWGG